MKLILLASLLLFVALDGKAQTNPSLKKTIDSLYQSDQSVQLKLKALLENQASPDSIQKQQKEEKLTFSRHIPVIKNIIAASGYPTPDKVGTDASHDFFVMVQHADTDPMFQASLLPTLKKLSEQSSISKKDYAYLYDRVQINTGRMQLYGTQLSYDKNGNLFSSENKLIYPANLYDPTVVDARRKSVGLEPLEEYYESVLKALGRPRKQTQ